MAAPGATFRRLLLPRLLPPRAALPAASPRRYGLRAAATGEAVTHTGQVRPRGSRDGWPRQVVESPSPGVGKERLGAGLGDVG